MELLLLDFFGESECTVQWEDGFKTTGSTSNQQFYQLEVDYDHEVTKESWWLSSTKLILEKQNKH